MTRAISIHHLQADVDRLRADIGCLQACIGLLQTLPECFASFISSFADRISPFAGIIWSFESLPLGVGSFQTAGCGLQIVLFFGPPPRKMHLMASFPQAEREIPALALPVLLQASEDSQGLPRETAGSEARRVQRGPGRQPARCNSVWRTRKMRESSPCSGGLVSCEGR